MAKVREVRRSSKKAIRSATTQVNRNRSPYLAKFVALIKSAMFEQGGKMNLFLCRIAGSG